ncbi:mCG1045241 [Mus musculus]|nr:mCG1045241 [Mus musculus]
MFGKGLNRTQWTVDNTLCYWDNWPPCTGHHLLNTTSSGILVASCCFLEPTERASQFLLD